MKRSIKIVPLCVVAAVYRQCVVSTAVRMVWKRWRSKVVVLELLVCLFGIAGHAQEGSGVSSAQPNPVALDGNVKPKECVEKVVEGSEKPQCINDKVKSLRLGLAGRFARGLQYQYQLNEQPRSVLISFGTGTTAVSGIARNPERYLQQHTLTFKFGELFPDRLSLFKRGSDYLKKYPQAADQQLSEFLCGDKPLITCLTRGGAWWQRGLMGVSVNVSLSERSAIKEGVFVTSPRFGREYQVNGGFVFDPAKLFPTATNWKGAFDDVQKIDKGLALLGASDVIPGRRPPWKPPLLAVFIPKVEFKILSQFDFLKYKGVLIESPFPERALNTWTFTWDLTRAIPDTKSRIDADAITEALADLKSGLGLKEQPRPQKRCTFHLSVGDRVIDVHPSFAAESCQKLAGIYEAKSYQLSCVLKDKDGGAEQSVDGLKIRPSDRPVVPSPNECKW